MRVNKISIKDKVEFVDNLGELCIGEVKARCAGRSCFEVKDITPDGKEVWKQVKGGGMYKEKIVNGFYGEVFKIKAKDIKRIISSAR
tara:strand:+ start:290 stop:550 length:261 start_codon:yes stop_codon:yes gene_type:complete